MRCEVAAEVKVRVEEQEREQEHGARRAAPMPYTLLAHDAVGGYAAQGTFARTNATCAAPLAVSATVASSSP